MDNLHRKLAPISSAAWDEVVEEVRRTFKTHLAGRRVVDTRVHDAAFAAVGSGHLAPETGATPGTDAGVEARVYGVRPVTRLRVPFTLSREAVDSVERGAPDSDWQPAKDDARSMALAEDRIVFEGWDAA